MLTKTTFCGLLREWRIVIQAVLFAAAGRGFDILSSLLMPAWVEEINPLARQPFTHSFWPAHALIVNSVELLEMGLYAVVLYLVIYYIFGRRYLAKIAACLPYLMMGLDGFIAGIHNELMYKLWRP